MATVRVAFVGSGGMARTHSEPLSKMRGVEIVGYCDLKSRLARAMTREFGGRAFTDPATMFDTVEPDCAYFCLPPFAHGAELEAVRRRIPFLVEKPIGLDLTLTRRIAAAVKRHRLITCAGYMNRYRKGVRKTRDILLKDPAILITGGWVGGTPRPGKGQGIWRWWVDKSKSGGQFLEQVTHTVDLVRFLCGDAVEVHAYAARGFNKGTPRNYSNEDASVVNIKLKSGAVANLWASCSTNAGGGGVSLNVYANHVTARFQGWGHSLELHQTGRRARRIRGEDDVFALEDRAFIKAVRTGDRSVIQSDYGDAAKTLAVTLAANESVRTGKPVKVAF